MRTITQTNVGIVIPTLNAGASWMRCLDALAAQSVKPQRVLVVDSTSEDNTVSTAKSYGFEVVVIARRDFNHGGTRQWAVSLLEDCEIVVFLTQDAILAYETSIERILAAFEDPQVALAYGRQLPHVNATLIESHARVYNYGMGSLKKSKITAGLVGAKVFFCSNSFAAYRRSTLISLGGFRQDLILGEDMEYAARAIKAGYTNAYCAEAAVFHSHDYSFGQVVSRYFDIGVFVSENRWMSREFGSHRGEGLRFVVSEVRFLMNRNPWIIFRALLQTGAKVIGYRLGVLHAFLPRRFKMWLSMFPAYWV